MFSSWVMKTTWGHFGQKVFYVNATTTVDFNWTGTVGFLKPASTNKAWLCWSCFQWPWYDPYFYPLRSQQHELAGLIGTVRNIAINVFTISSCNFKCFFLLRCYSINVMSTCQLSRDSGLTSSTLTLWMCSASLSVRFESLYLGPVWRMLEHVPCVCGVVSLLVRLSVICLAWLNKACWSHVECDRGGWLRPWALSACWLPFWSSAWGQFESAGSMGLPLLTVSPSLSSTLPGCIKRATKGRWVVTYAPLSSSTQGRATAREHSTHTFK